MRIIDDPNYFDIDHRYDNELFVPLSDSYYLISNYGRISRSKRNYKRFSPDVYIPARIMKPTLAKNGYHVMSMLIGFKKKTMLLHRVIATAWLPNHEDLREVDHINCDKTDNRILNLEWVSSKENKRRAVETGLFDRKGEKHHGNKLNAPQVRDALKRNLINKESQASIARSYGLNPETIRLICIGTNWPHIYQEFIKEINP